MGWRSWIQIKYRREAVNCSYIRAPVDGSTVGLEMVQAPVMAGRANIPIHVSPFYHHNFLCCLFYFGLEILLSGARGKGQDRKVRAERRIRWTAADLQVSGGHWGDGVCACSSIVLDCVNPALSVLVDSLVAAARITGHTYKQTYRNMLIGRPQDVPTIWEELIICPSINPP